MAITWNRLEQHVPNILENLPYLYLRDFFEQYADRPVDEITPTSMLPNLIGMAFQGIRENQAGIHPSLGVGYPSVGPADAFMRLSECLQCWIACMDIPTPDDRIMLMDTLFTAFEGLHADPTLNDWSSSKIAELGASWLYGTFKDVVDAWIEEVHTPLLSSVQWRYYALICNQCSMDTRFSAYCNLWADLSHVPVEAAIAPKMRPPSQQAKSKPAKLSWHGSLELLLLPMIHDPCVMDHWIDHLHAKTSSTGTSLSIVQHEHLEWLHSLLHHHHSASPAHHALQSWLEAHRERFVFLDAYANIRTFSSQVPKPKKDEIISYMESPWFAQQILTRRVATSEVACMISKSKDIAVQRHLVACALGPILELPLSHPSRHHCGIYNNQQEDKAAFLAWCKSEDLGIRILAVSYMLKQFQPYDYNAFPFANRISKDGDIRLFGKSTKMLSMYVPELVPLWDMFADLHNFRHNIEYHQSVFLWNYYQQHFGKNHSMVQPLDASALLESID